VLSGCGQPIANDPTNNVEASNAAVPQYSQQDGDTYMYVGALSPEEKKEGKSAPVVNIRYLGQKGPNYRLEQVDDSGAHLGYYECASPCRVMKQTLSSGEYSKQAITAGSIIDSAFADAINGLLQPANGSVQTTTSNATQQSLADRRPDIVPTSTSTPPIVAPSITGEWHIYRTRIAQGWWTEPTLDHRYVIIRWGCGTSCTFNVIGDHRTGRIYDLGLGGEAYPMLDLRFGNDSNVIRARWEDSENDACVTQSFIWMGTKLSPLSDRVMTPRYDHNCPDLT
jgi:hypothetical protein